LHDNCKDNNDNTTNNISSYDIVAHATLLVDLGIAQSVVEHDVRVLSHIGLKVREYAPYLEVYPDSHYLPFFNPRLC